MTKTVFIIQLHNNGDLNDAIVRMITNHNAGKVEINLDLFPVYGKAKFAEWPTIAPRYEFKHNIGEGVMEILENDKPTMTITERVIHELAPEPETENDIPDELFRQTQN